MAGRERMKLGPAKEVAAKLVEPVLADIDYAGAPAIVMMNGMGGKVARGAMHGFGRKKRLK